MEDGCGKQNPQCEWLGTCLIVIQVSCSVNIGWCFVFYVLHGMHACHLISFQC